jgi:hypothetical protein
MLWLGIFIGYTVGSIITGALLYFLFRSEEIKKAEQREYIKKREVFK